MDKTDLARLDTLGEAIRACNSAALREAGGLEDVHVRLISARPPRPRRRWLLWVCAATATLVLLILALLSWSPGEVMTFSVASGDSDPRASTMTTVAQGEPGQWLGARTTPVLARFSDGSTMRLAPGSSARVERVEHDGVSFLLEQGTARFQLAAHEALTWSVRSGPFRVHVLGTRFQMRWDPRTRKLGINLEQGRVEVSGPEIGTRQMTAAEVMEVTLDQGQVVVKRSRGDGTGARFARGTSRPSPTTSGDPAERTTTPKPPGVGPSPARADPLSKVTRPRRGLRPAAGSGSGRRPARQEVTEDLPPSTLPGKAAGAVVARTLPVRPDPVALVFQLATRGRYREAMAALKKVPWPGVLSRGNSTQIQALGDAARLTGSTARAVQAYRLLRRRHPGTPAAALAAFSLGRLYFDQRRRYRLAARWFRIYIAELPRGPLVQESRGRLMEALQRGGDRRAARRVARQYLSRSPSGPHAQLARTLTGRGDGKKR